MSNCKPIEKLQERETIYRNLVFPLLVTEAPSLIGEQRIFCCF